VGPDNQAHDIVIQRGLGFGLDENAIECVREWRFEPGMKDGEPVPVKATIEVNFKLSVRIMAPLPSLP
jgi:TonB family protein